MVGMPRTRLMRKAEETGDRVPVPSAWRMGLGEFVRLTAAQVGKDHLQAFAGNVAFRGLFAIFPSLLALLWLLTAVHQRPLLNTLVDFLSLAMPKAATDPLRQQLAQPPSAQASGSLTLGAAVSTLFAIAALTSAVNATMDAMNAMYAVQESRPVRKRLGIALALSLAVTVLLLGALVMVVFGAGIGAALAERAGLGSGFQWAWVALSWPALVLAVLIAFSLVYYFAPDVQQELRWVRAGSIIAVALWLLFAVLLSVYVNHSSAYSRTYGALTGMAALMLWAYGSAYILLLGAEMNQVIEMHHPEGKNEGERELPSAGPA